MQRKLFGIAFIAMVLWIFSGALEKFVFAAVSETAAPTPSSTGLESQKEKSTATTKASGGAAVTSDEGEIFLEPEFKEDLGDEDTSGSKQKNGGGKSAVPSEDTAEGEKSGKGKNEAGESEGDLGAQDEKIMETNPSEQDEELEVSTKEAAERKLPTVLTTLEECKMVAEANSKRIQAARKEMEYARGKLIEADRNFLPQLKASWEREDGTSSQGSGSADQKFNNLKYGIEGQVVLFQGGKMVYTLKQARANMEIARRKLEQASQEMIFKVEKAYYDLVKAQMIFDVQSQLSKNAESGLSFSREAYRRGLNAYHEFLNVQSQTDQTYYKLLAAQQDIALAEMALRQACNLDPSNRVQINAVLTFTDFNFNYSLEGCLDLAYQHRPDLLLSELTTLSDLFAVKMAVADGLPKVELLGSVGKDGQAQGGEPVELSDAWSIRLQATWMLGGNSLQYALEKKRNVPKKFGNTDNTKDSQVQDVSLALFDKLENFSNLSKAALDKANAEAEWIELKGKVATEVQENYFNYQKAMTMVTASLSQIKFREKDLEVNQAKQKMNDAPFSQVLGAQIALEDERAKYVQALADYYTAIAGLFKAMGLSK